MATGDVTITVAIEGGVSKAVTVVSAHRGKAIEYLNITADPDYNDTTWAAAMANKAGNGIVNAANKQLVIDAQPSPATFTAVT